MGFFDFLARKPKQPTPQASAVAGPQAPAAPPPNLSPWQQSLWQAQRNPRFAWKDDNEPARSVVRALLSKAAPAFGHGKVVNGEPTAYATIGALHITRFGAGWMHVEDCNPELRGVWDSVPIRIPVSLSTKKIWTIEMRCEESKRFFVVLRDLARIPAKPDPNDPWAKGQQQCVFLGRGIFLDDTDPNLTRDWLIPSWASVPVAAQELLVEAMERLDLQFFELSNSNSALFALGNRTLEQLDDPIAYMQSCAAFLAEFGKALAATAGANPLLSAPPTAPPITCRFCSSIFILASGKNTCPNCGAPAAG